MKQTFGAVAVCSAVLAVLTPAVGSTAGSVRIDPRSISFWNGQRGLVASTSNGSAGRVATTDDGGRTWKVRFRSDYPITLVATASQRWAWTVVGPSLYRSEDRGRTWQPVSKAHVGLMSFGSAKTGLALVTPNHVDSSPQSTHDGGRSWHTARDPCRQIRKIADELDGVAMVSAKRGWALCLGQPGAGSQGKAVLETNDAGRTWALRAAAPIGGKGRGGLEGGGYPGGLAFNRTGRGMLWDVRGGATFVTADGGRTWRPGGPPTRFDRVGVISTSLVGDPAFALLKAYTGRGARLVVSDRPGAPWRVVHRWR